MITFKQFLLEMPYYSDGDSFAGLKKELKGHLISVNTHKKNSVKIANNHHYVDIGENQRIYYHTSKLGRIHSVSLVNGKDNRQEFVHKVNSSGSADKIHESMLYHAKEFGSLDSHFFHTKGGKHLWRSLIKKEPKNYSFSHKHLHTGKESNITSKNVDLKDSGIWSIHNLYVNKQHVIRMKHHETT